MLRTNCAHVALLPSHIANEFLKAGGCRGTLSQLLLHDRYPRIRQHNILGCRDYEKLVVRVIPPKR